MTIGAGTLGRDAHHNSLGELDGDHQLHRVGGFSSHLANSRESEASASAPAIDANSLANHLSEIHFSDLIGEQTLILAWFKCTEIS